MTNIDKISLLFTGQLLITSIFVNYPYLSAFTLSGKVFILFTSSLAIFYATNWTANFFKPNSFGVVVGGTATFISLILCALFAVIVGYFVGSGNRSTATDQLLFFIFVLIKNSPLIIVSGCFWGWVCKKVLIKLLTRH